MLDHRPTFDHEKLRVYQEALRFVAWSSALPEGRRPHGSLGDQLDRASTSIALNIAEGNGRHTSRDRCRFFDIARASSLECAACLDVLVARGHIEPEHAAEGKQILSAVVSMLVGLIRSNSDRVCEEPAEYTAGPVIDGRGSGGERGAVD